MDRRLRPRLRAALFVIASVLASVIAGPLSAAPTELFVSEYVEGSSNNTALELFNGTGATVTLTGSYDVVLGSKGNPA